MPTPGSVHEVGDHPLCLIRHSIYCVSAPLTDQRATLTLSKSVRRTPGRSHSRVARPGGVSAELCGELRERPPEREVDAVDGVRVADGARLARHHLEGLDHLVRQLYVAVGVDPRSLALELGVRQAKATIQGFAG